MEVERLRRTIAAGGALFNSWQIAPIAWLRLDMRVQRREFSDGIRGLNKRFDDTDKHFNERFDQMLREFGDLRERMAKLEGSLEGFIAGRRDRDAA